MCQREDDHKDEEGGNRDQQSRHDANRTLITGLPSPRPLYPGSLLRGLATGHRQLMLMQLHGLRIRSAISREQIGAGWMQCFPLGSNIREGGDMPVLWALSSEGHFEIGLTV